MSEYDPVDQPPPNTAGHVPDQASVLPTRLRLAIATVSIGLLLTFIIIMALVLRGQTSQSGFGIFSYGRIVNLEPRPAPDFVLTTYNGEQLQLSSLRGQVVLLNFWASWCPPCRVEAPVLQRAADSLAASGLAVIGVDVWDDVPQARAFLDEFAITYPNAEDTTRSIPVEYGVTGLPETLVISPAGVLVSRWVGPIDDKQLLDLVGPLLESG
jgi:DsbE subfamily thiol:disulfide oxidoreductase